MIRMLIVGYCYGLRSERRLTQEVLPEMNGRAPALGPPGDCLDDLDPWVIPADLRRV